MVEIEILEEGTDELVTTIELTDDQFNVLQKTADEKGKTLEQQVNSILEEYIDEKSKNT